MSNDLPAVMGVQEVMSLLGKSQATVLRLARDGQIVGRKLGPGLRNAWAFTGESVAAYLETLDKGDAA